MSDDVRVNAHVTIPASEVMVKATRSGGPGGQHVNTSSTRVELRWNVLATRVLDEATRVRVAAALAHRMDAAGDVRVVASEHRSQRRNREAAAERLAALVRGALVRPRRRIATAPSRAARAARMEEKRKRGETKRRRRQRDFD